MAGRDITAGQQLAATVGWRAGVAPRSCLACRMVNRSTAATVGWRAGVAPPDARQLDGYD